MADNVAKAGKKRIAVVDFTDLQGNITELGRFIAEELSVDLTMTAKGFEVIDRNHLNRILAEHKLSISGIVDQKTVQKLGQIAGVDAIITGSITPLERSIRVVCKVIATDTARVIGASKGDIAKTKAIEELFGRGIETGLQGATSDKPTTITKAEKKVKKGNFLFELQSCELLEKTVSCYLLITNNGEDKKLLIYEFESTRIIDESGIQHRVKDVRIGGSRDSTKLASGIPVKAVITFDKVSPRTSRLALLEIKCNAYEDDSAFSGSKFTIQFRNIPLSR
jgi:TolB-like protein